MFGEASTNPKELTEQDCSVHYSFYVEGKFDFRNPNGVLDNKRSYLLENELRDNENALVEGYFITD